MTSAPPERGQALEPDEGIVYRSQLCRYSAQKQTLCFPDRINHPSPALRLGKAC